jgi:ankyrin repeat protein
MKTKLIAILMVFAVTLYAEPSEQALKLARQMQEAVLRTHGIPEVEALLKQGVDVNAPIGCGTFSPLDGAIHTQNVEMLRFLLAHKAKLRGDELARAALSPGHEQAIHMVKALLHAGADANARFDGFTALFWAAYNENKDLLRLLLARPGIKLDQTTDDGETALMTAVTHGNEEIVAMLLKAGANVSITNKQGETAAALAQKEIEKQQAIISKLQSRPK